MNIRSLHLLNTYLKELHATVQRWLSDEDKFPEDYPVWFNSNSGICDNWADWTDANSVTISEYYDGKAELARRFRRDGMCVVTPFNRSLVEFCEEGDSGRLWYNPRRVAWLAQECAE